jgi:hypothetical protein
MNDRLGMRRRAVKQHRPILLIAIIVLIVSGCASLPIAADNAVPVDGVKVGASVVGGVEEATATPAVKDEDVAHPTDLPAELEHSADEMAAIALGDTTTVNGSGASVDGSTVRITAGGTYSISGTLKDGQIVVDTEDKKTVKLVLSGVDITSASSGPIYVLHAEATVITLADGTENRITDGESYDIEDPETNEPNAAIFSKSNLAFDGNGSLTVDANYHNAITSKDELNIAGGSINVNAAHDGIRGRDYIAIKNGNITVNARADGMKANNGEDPERGFISIEDGTINVTAGEDGIQAANGVVIRGGTIAVSSGGGSANSSRSGSGGDSPGNSGMRNGSTDSGPSVSAKGIAADSDIQIEGGTITVDSSDDAIHSNAGIGIYDGNIAIASGDQGIHSESTLTLNGGDVSIAKSLEAIEGPVIAISGGNTRVVASKNGINVGDGSNRPPVNGQPGRNNTNSSVDKHLTMEGGYVVVDTATGDGLDVNGWVKMTGGTVIVNGPVVNFNGALDYEREFTMAGGILVAVGSFGMAQAPDATSTQRSLVLSLGSPQPAGTLVHIETSDGAGILTFAPIREYQSVVYSSPELKTGSTYNAYLGGSSTGSVLDGVYSGGSYTRDTRREGFTILSIGTNVASVARGFPSGGRR